MDRAARTLLVCVSCALGCAAPTLSQDGQLVFSQGGRRGASVLTANGVEFMDSTEIPRPVVRHSVDEPWRPATGFLIPKDGVWRKTSEPAPVEGRGLLVVLRSSDALVPSWGGEVLLRMDAIVPPEAFPDAAASLRPPKLLAIVIDGHTPNSAALAGVALDDLGERDRVTLIDSARARTILPLLPGSHRTLLQAAAEQVAAVRTRSLSDGGKSAATGDAIRDLPAALALARGWLARRSDGPRQILVITDGAGVAEAGSRLDAELAADEHGGIHVTAVGATDRLDPAALAPLGPDVHAGGSFDDLEDAVAAAVPPPGDVVLKDVTLLLSSVPAPSRVIEISGGRSTLGLDADRLDLGDLYVGEARTEVARIAVPVFVSGEALEVTVTASYHDAAGEAFTASRTIKSRYSSDVEDIAENRHGDVIAYASALAMVRRLDRAFAGSSIDRLGGLRPVVAWQARSLDALARQTHDEALGMQAEILTTLLGALD